jgi:hypothetical protein
MKSKNKKLNHKDVIIMHLLKKKIHQEILI